MSEAAAGRDVASAVKGLLAPGPALLTPEGLAEAAGGAEAVAALLEDAWKPFAAADPAARPLYLTADGRRLCFRTAKSLLAVEEMKEDGALVPSARLVRPAGVPRLPDGVVAGLHDVLARLAARDAFRGQVYAAASELERGVVVASAARARLLGVAAELLIRAALLRALGVPDGELAAEASRFEESAFLDHAASAPGRPPRKP
jgi:hypothetical protein